MGANFESVTFLTDDKGVIKSQWDGAVEHSQHMDGCSYSGSIGMLDGCIDWVRREPCLNEQEAEEYIADHHNKWDGPMAVPFKIKGGKKVPAYLINAKKKSQEAKQKLEELETHLANNIISAKNDFVGCRGCKSKLSRQHLTSSFCPLCHTVLLSETSLKRIEKAKDKAQKAFNHWIEMRDKATKANATGKIGYVVGGLCSS
jgi:hypothetical protein